MSSCRLEPTNLDEDSNRDPQTSHKHQDRRRASGLLASSGSLCFASTGPILIPVGDSQGYCLKDAVKGPQFEETKTVVNHKCLEEYQNDS